MTEYGVIYEQAGDGSWSASAIDMPVFAVGDSREEAEHEIRSAIAFFLEYLEEKGETVPRPASRVGTVTL
jgi:predicted RNase H-like HicB family nuclease